MEEEKGMQNAEKRPTPSHDDVYKAVFDLVGQKPNETYEDLLKVLPSVKKADPAELKELVAREALRQLYNCPKDPLLIEYEKAAAEDDIDDLSTEDGEWLDPSKKAGQEDDEELDENGIPVMKLSRASSSFILDGPGDIKVDNFTPEGVALEDDPPATQLYPGCAPPDTSKAPVGAATPNGPATSSATSTEYVPSALARARPPAGPGGPPAAAQPGGPPVVTLEDEIRALRLGPNQPRHQHPAQPHRPADRPAAAAAQESAAAAAAEGNGHANGGHDDDDDDEDDDEDSPEIIMEPPAAMMPFPTSSSPSGRALLTGCSPGSGSRGAVLAGGGAVVAAGGGARPPGAVVAGADGEEGEDGSGVGSRGVWGTSSSPSSLGVVAAGGAAAGEDEMDDGTALPGACRDTSREEALWAALQGVDGRGLLEHMGLAGTERSSSTAEAHAPPAADAALANGCHTPHSTDAGEGLTSPGGSASSGSDRTRGVGGGGPVAVTQQESEPGAGAGANGTNGAAAAAGDDDEATPPGSGGAPTAAGGVAGCGPGSAVSGSRGGAAGASGRLMHMCGGPAAAAAAAGPTAEAADSGRALMASPAAGSADAGLADAGAAGNDGTAASEGAAAAGGGGGGGGDGGGGSGSTAAAGVPELPVVPVAGALPGGQQPQPSQPAPAAAAPAVNTTTEPPPAVAAGAATAAAAAGSGGRELAVIGGCRGSEESSEAVAGAELAARPCADNSSGPTLEAVEAFSLDPDFDYDNVKLTPREFPYSLLSARWPAAGGGGPPMQR